MEWVESDVQDDVGPIVIPTPPALAGLALLGVAKALLLVLQRVGHMEVRHVRPVEVRRAGCCVSETANISI